MAAVLEVGQKFSTFRLRPPSPDPANTVATRCQILRLKCTKFDFGWGSAPDPAGGAYSTTPPLLFGQIEPWL